MTTKDPAAATKTRVMHAHAKLLQTCPTLCNPMDHISPGSIVHGILQVEYWSGLPFPPPGDLPNRGIEPTSLMSPALAAGGGGIFTTGTTWETLHFLESFYHKWVLNFVKSFFCIY